MGALVYADDITQNVQVYNYGLTYMLDILCSSYGKDNRGNNGL